MTGHIPVGVAEAAVGLVLIDETTCVLRDHQVLVVTLHTLLKVSQLLIALSQVPECAPLVQHGTRPHHLIKLQKHPSGGVYDFLCTNAKLKSRFKFYDIMPYINIHEKRTCKRGLSD